MFVSFFFYKHGTQQLISSSAGLDMQLTNLILCEYNGLIKGNERHKEILVEKNIISRGRGGFGQKRLLVCAENVSLFKGRLSFFPILSSSFGTLYKKKSIKDLIKTNYRLRKSFSKGHLLSNLVSLRVPK